MKITARFAALVVATGMVAAPAAMLAQGPQPWEAPPGSFTRDVQRNAYHDGIEGARRDMENHRRPNVRNRDEFRNYRGPEPRVYRDAFRAGYNAFWSHTGPGPGGPGPDGPGPRPY